MTCGIGATCRLYGLGQRYNALTSQPNTKRWVVKIFISWSKGASGAVAAILKEWLPQVIQELEPWASKEDIAKGSRGRNMIAQELEGTSDGIICITGQNVTEPWLNFEAGALSKLDDLASVRTLLLDLTPSNVVGPLAGFQHTTLHDRADMLKFMHSINDRCNRSLDKAVLERSFATNWDDLVAQLKAIPNEKLETSNQPSRSSEQLLGEILERVRSLERRMELDGERFNEAVSMLKLEQRRAQRRNGETVSRIAQTRNSATNDRNQLIGEEFKSDRMLAEEAEVLSAAVERTQRMHVIHDKFGRGVILESMGASLEGDEMVMVRFIKTAESKVMKLSNLRPDMTN